MKKYYYKSLGCLRDKKDRRDFRIAGIMQTKEIHKQVFSLEELFPPKNQCSRGSCVSQGNAHHKERQEEVACSARFIMALTKKLEGNKKYGAYTKNGLKIVQQYGVCKEELYPESSPEMSWEEYIDDTKIPQKCLDDALNHKSLSYWKVNNNINEIRQVLFEKKKSIVMSMAWHKEFNSRNLVDGKILPVEFKDYVGGHCVSCCGFDDFKELLKIKNSWGNGYGDNGYFYMSYSIFNRIVWDCFCSLDMPKELPVDNRYGQQRTWQSYLREKVMAFNPWLRKKIKRLPSNREIKGLCYGFWSYESIFDGKYNDIWLTYTKPEAIKRKLIK